MKTIKVKLEDDSHERLNKAIKLVKDKRGVKAYQAQVINEAINDLIKKLDKE